MATFKFYLKRPKVDAETGLFLSIHSLNKRSKFYTKISVHPKEWDQDGQRVIKRTDRSEANAYLATLLAEAGKITSRLRSERLNEPSSQDIREELEKLFGESENVEQSMTFLTFFERFLEKSAMRTNPKTNQPIASATLKGWKNNLRIFQDFEKFRRRQIRFEEIDFNFYAELKTYLEKQRGYSLNTIGKCIKVLKIVLNDATAEGVNTNQKFRSTNFRALSEVAGAVYLNEQELEELQHLDLSNNKRLEQVRDWFLIGCWTGLRFSDWKNLTPENISEDGNTITLLMQKTQKVVAVPVSPELAAILAKYRTSEGQTLPKLISDQRFNDYLKELAQMLECLKAVFSKDRTKGGLKVSNQMEKWQLVSTHTARRSFATNMFKRGYPVPLIMAATGHKTETEFYKYIQMSPSDKAEQLRQLMIGSASAQKLRIAE
jgi:integrase